MANINKNEIGYNENTTANALMVQYKRGLAAPMDISEVFTSLTSAQHYAKGDPIAYAGQTIAVAGEGIKTEVYKITSGGTLVRLVDENALTNINQIIEDNEEVTAAALNELNNRINNINTKTVLASTNEKCYLIGYSSKEGNTQTLNTSSTDVYMENGELFAVSDETLKDFGSDIDIDLNKLAELPKVYYSLKNDADKKQMIGTSAQKLREIYPELVSEDANGKLAVSYEKLSIVALAAIDKLNKKHEEKLAQLESELDKIKKELNII